MKKVKNLTKKLKLVESSSSKSSKSSKVVKSPKTKKTKKTKNPSKKRLLIIESTSSSQPKTFVKKEGEIKIETPNGENVCFYVFDWGNMNGAVIKPTVQNWSYSGVMQYYHQFMQVVEKHEMNK